MSLYAILRPDLTFDRWVYENSPQFKPGRYISGIDTGIPSFVAGLQKVVEGSPAFVSGKAYKVYDTINLNPTEILIYNTPDQTGLYIDVLKLTSGINLVSGQRISGDTETGSLLDSKIYSLSGFALNATGILDNKINALSGYNNTIFVPQDSLTTSGQTLRTTIFNGDSNLSGVIGTTGFILYTITTGLSGFSNNVYATISNLGLTGQDLLGKISGTGQNLYLILTGLSGQSNLNYVGFTILGNTGTALLNHIFGGDINISGNLGLTGNNLYRIITGLSGQNNINYATIANLGLTGSNLYSYIFGLSGTNNLQIQNTGQQAWLAANNNSVNTSGNLTQTGSVLNNKIVSLSGFALGVSGALQSLIAGGGSIVKVTGSQDLSNANFTGIGSVSIIYDNNFILISGTTSQGGGGSPGGSDTQIQYNNNGNFAGANSVLIHDGDLMLQRKASTPSTPPQGNMKLFARSIAGGYLPAFIGPSNVDSSLQPLFARNSIGYWKPIGNATTVPIANGLIAPVTTGTATARNVAATNFYTSLRRIGYVSAATAGAAAGARSNALQFWRGNVSGAGGFRFITRFGISDAAAVAGARMFVGLIGSANPIPANQTVPAQLNIIGIGHEPGETTFKIYNNDGTSTAASVDLGSNFPCTGRSTQAVELALFAPPNASFINYQVTMLNPDITVTGTLTTDIPASTQLLAPQLWRANGATALAVGIDLISLYIETDY